MMKKNLLVVLAAVALVSCSDSDAPVMPENGERAEIKLKSAIYDVNAVTRGPKGSEDIADFNARVLARQGSDDYGELVNKIVAFEATDEEVGLGVKYPDATTNIDLVGLYPETVWTDDKYEIDGTTDIMIAKTSTNETAALVELPRLTFNHLLTKLEIHVEATPVAPTVFGDIKSISVTSPNSSITFTPADGSVESTGDSKAISLFDADNNDAKYEGGAISNGLIGYAMVAPSADGTYTLNVETDNKNFTDVSVALNDSNGDPFTGNTAGKSFTITLKFTAFAEMETLGEIANWGDEGNTDVELKD